MMNDLQTSIVFSKRPSVNFHCMPVPTPSRADVTVTVTLNLLEIAHAIGARLRAERSLGRDPVVRYSDAGSFGNCAQDICSRRTSASSSCSLLNTLSVSCRCRYPSQPRRPLPAKRPSPHTPISSLPSPIPASSGSYSLVAIASYPVPPSDSCSCILAM